MVQRCCVPLCETKVGDVDINGAKVRFHRIPLISEKFIKWRDKITNSGEFKPEPDLTINSRICSKHFLREDYISGDEQKPGTSGNHVLAKDVLPTIFKWNDECEISRAIPFVKKIPPPINNGQSEIMELTRNQEIQCTLQADKLQQELNRKNLVIRQLLQRLAEVEDSDEPSKTDKPSAFQVQPIPSHPEEIDPLTTNEAIPTAIDPHVTPTRVSVIRRVCDINKPPKKRKIIFDEPF